MRIFLKFLIFVATGVALAARGSLAASMHETDFIRAEVQGTLQKNSGGQGQPEMYFILVKSAPLFEETRVWLQRAEDKNRALDHQLSELLGKKVTAKGQLKQLPDNAQAMVPMKGMYLEASSLSFEIKESDKN